MKIKSTMTKIPYNVTTAWIPLIDNLDENDPLLTKMSNNVAATTSIATSSNSNNKNIRESAEKNNNNPCVQMKSKEENDTTMPSLDRRLSTLSLHSNITKSKKEETVTATKLLDKKKKKQQQFDDPVEIITCDDPKSTTTLSCFMPGRLDLERCYPTTPNGGGSDGDYSDRAHKSFYSNNKDYSNKSSSNSTISSSSSCTIRSNSSGITFAASPHSSSSSPFSSSMMSWEMMLQTSFGATPPAPPAPPSPKSLSSSHDHLRGASKLTGIAADTFAIPKIWSKSFYPVSSPASLLFKNDLSASSSSPAAAKNAKASNCAMDDLEKHLLQEPLLTSPAYKSRTKKEPRIGPSPPQPPLTIVRLRHNLMDDKKSLFHHVNVDNKNEDNNEKSTLPTTTVNKKDACSGKRPLLKRMDSFSDYY